MEDEIRDDIKTEIDKEEKEVEEKINEENENKKEEQIKELKIGEFQEILDPIKSAFDEETKKDEFFRNDNLNSLVLVNENKNTMLDVIKLHIYIYYYKITIISTIVLNMIILIVKNFVFVEFKKNLE